MMLQPLCEWWHPATIFLTAQILQNCGQLLRAGKPIMDKLTDELRHKIVITLNLEETKPEDIAENDPLVGGELGLDSIDILELVMMIEKDYAVKIDNRELGAKVFATLKSLAQYIREETPGATA